MSENPYKKPASVEGLIIYKQFLELINYCEIITQKFPMPQGFALSNNIKNVVYECMRNILKAYKCYDTIQKLSLLNEIDSDLKMIKVLVRTAYKQKFFNSRNLRAWSRKLYNIGNILGGWIKSCRKQLEIHSIQN